jgi:hypothetical protein
MRADRHYLDLLAARAPSGSTRLVPIASLNSPGISDVPALVPLIDSVKQHGVLQPLLVQDRGNDACQLGASARAGCTRTRRRSNGNAVARGSRLGLTILLGA